MIFDYNELKENVEEDFNRFFRVDFDDKQIYSAVLNEYKYGDDFSFAENICIHFDLALIYKSKNLKDDFIMEDLNNLIEGK